LAFLSSKSGVVKLFGIYCLKVKHIFISL